ncbi:MAG: hypothetical protein KDK97_17635 [Verrucomicrobiales bacterium]|nr:hypothetical protein [Verrucomicrobiales bacterium]MCP5560702.1 hypothetical protein [Verrucomicrobiaceae bacterium]
MKTAPLGVTLFGTLHRMLVILIIGLAPGSLSAQILREYYAAGVTPAEGLGRSVAINGKYILGGRPGFNSSTGDVVVFDAVTGRILRTLSAPDADRGPGDEFGFAVAVRGTEAIVGAPGDEGGQGTVYTFDLKTGKMVARFSGYYPSGRFGHALAAEGQYIVIGAPNAEFGGTDRGGAYIYKSPPGTAGWTGTELVKPATENGAKFGQSVAIHGQICAVGTPYFDSSATVDSGRVVLYSVDGTHLANFGAPTPIANAAYGWAIGLTGTSVVVGAPVSNTLYVQNYAGVLKASTSGIGSFGRSVAVGGRWIAAGAPGIGSVAPNQGYTELFEAAYGTNLNNIGEITPQSGLIGSEFSGTCLAIYGDTVAIGVPGRYVSDGGTIVASGSIMTARFLTQPLNHNINNSGVREIVRSGETVPYTDRATVRAPTQLSLGSISTEDNMQAILSLSGPGTTGGRNQAWTVENRSLSLIRQSGSAYLSSGTIKQILNPVSNVANHFGVNQLLVGTGVNATNNTAFVAYNTAALYEIVRKGTVTPVGKFRSFSQPRQVKVGVADAHYSVPVTLSSAPAVTVSRTTDSGLRFASSTGVGTFFIQEGDPSPTGSPYGQFAPWISAEEVNAVFAPAIAHATVSQALIKRTVSTGATTLLATRTQAAPGVTGGVFRTFLSAQVNGFSGGETLFRAALQPGTGISAANNEGLWRINSGGTIELRLRKGLAISPLDVELKVKRILKYWVTTTNGEVRALVQFSGPGVNASNDVALIAIPLSNVARILLREGDAAPGCSSARIGTILRVDANLTEAYTALVTLATSTGLATAADNLVLYACPASTITVNSNPAVLLRKGTRYRPSAPATLTSIAFSSNIDDPTGVCASGLGHALSAAAPTTDKPVTVGVLVKWSDRTQSALAVTAP